MCRLCIPETSLEMIWLTILLFLFSIWNRASGNHIPIHWYAPFYSGGGYSSEAIAFVSILSNFSFPFSVSQHGDSINEKYIKNMRASEKNLLNSKFTRVSTPGEVSICHSEPGAWHAPFPHYHTQRCPSSHSSYKIGRTMFETDRIPSGWVDRLNFMDEIWVPTPFAQEIFVKEGVDKRKVHIISEPVDTDFYSPQSFDNSDERLTKLKSDISERLAAQDTSEITDSTFLYLFVGKWEYRKGVQLLVQAFLTEFNQSFTDSTSTAAEQRVDLALIIVTSAYHSTNDFFHALIQDLLNEQILSPSIFLSPHQSSSSLSIKDLDPSYPVTQLLRRIVLLTDVPQLDMPVLYRLSNVLVIPSRGEGWGRPHVEAMSCGTPIIATNWSGVTAYLTELNGFPLAMEGLVDVKGWKGHRWAEPSMPHLQHLLRYTLNHRDETLLKGSRARQDIVRSYSYASFAKSFQRQLQRIEQTLLSREKSQQSENVKEL